MGAMKMTKYVTAMLVLVVAVLAVALFVRGGEVLTALAISTTNSTVATVNITASQTVCSPTVCYDADDATDTIHLQGGDQRYVKCNTTCNAPNGWGYIRNYTGAIGTSGADCTPSSNLDCYRNASCQNFSVVNTTAQLVQCTYLFWFNADNTTEVGTWTGNIKAGDIGGSTSPTSSDTIGLSTLLAIGVEGVLAFNSQTAATNETTNTHQHNIYNYGNVEIDFKVNGTAMTCQSGSIAAEYLKANLTSGGNYQASYSLTSALSGPDTGGKFGSTNLAKSSTTSGAPVVNNKVTYWGIGIPAGVSGNCESTIWFAAVLS